MFDYTDKKKNINIFNQYVLNKTLAMFDYTNLPDSIPELELEKLLQTKGKVFITEKNGDLIAFECDSFGKVDAYNRPTKVNVRDYENQDIKEHAISDGVLIKNDSSGLGLLPLIERYSYLLNENMVNLVLYGFNSRIQKIFSVSDDSTKSSVEMYLRKIKDGDLTIITESSFLEDLKVQGNGYQGGVSASGLIEIDQYLKANLYNEIGLQSNTNTKKERLITSEVDQNSEVAYPLVYNFYNSRLDGLEKLNEKYDLTVSVEFGSIWKNREMRDQTTHED